MGVPRRIKDGIITIVGKRILYDHDRMQRPTPAARIWEVNMEEKVYKTMGSTGGGSLAIGICILVTGIVSGVLLIVNGARLLKNRERLTF